MPTTVSIVVCAICILAEMLRSLVRGSCCLDIGSATCRKGRQAPALFQDIVTGCGEGILACLVFVNVNAKAWLTSMKMYYEAAYTDTVLNL